MDGEIVEEGSHTELICAKGKYHDLWSKQILVEAEDDQPMSRNQKTYGDSAIANPDSDERDKQTSKENSKKPATVQKSKSGHKREVRDGAKWAQC